MGLGGLREVSLAEARKRVEEFRSLRSKGTDILNIIRNINAAKAWAG
jgi:hypothetical protein